MWMGARDNGRLILSQTKVLRVLKMDLNVLSYNVHGLNSRRARTRFKIFLKE